MSNFLSQNLLVMGLLGLFILISLLIFMVARKQIKENRLLRSELESVRSINIADLTSEIGEPLAEIKYGANDLIEKTDDENIKTDLAQILIYAERISVLFNRARDTIRRT